MDAPLGYFGKCCSCVEIEFVENRANGHLNPAAVSFTGVPEESRGGAHLWRSLDSHCPQDSAHD